jgi:hypothetical protein
MDVSLRPKSKFLGNSAASIMEGEANLHLLNYGANFVVVDFSAMFTRQCLNCENFTCRS